MSNPRTNIRNGIANILIGVTPAGHNVYTSPFRSMAEDEYPALFVLAENERVERHSVSRLQHKLDLTIRCVVADGVLAGESTSQNAARITDALDSLMVEVQRLLVGTGSQSWRQALLCDVTDISLKYIQDIEYSSQGERFRAQGDLTFEVLYYFEPVAPGECYPFLRFVGSHDMAAPRNNPPTPYAPDGQIDVIGSVNLAGAP